jgi:hypothetical protein
VNALQGGFAAPPPELIEPEVAKGATDQEGVFVLHDVAAGSLALLGVDLGGPRGTARLLDVALERGQTYDLGDIVLPPHVTLTGVVLDEDEQPIANARVRVIPQLPAPIPTQVLDVGLQDLRRDSCALYSAKSQGLRGRIEMPAWLRAAFDRLPLPTTTSGADGPLPAAGRAGGRRHRDLRPARLRRQRARRRPDRPQRRARHRQDAPLGRAAP